MDSELGGNEDMHDTFLFCDCSLEKPGKFLSCQLIYALIWEKKIYFARAH